MHEYHPGIQIFNTDSQNPKIKIKSSPRTIRTRIQGHFHVYSFIFMCKKLTKVDAQKETGLNIISNQKYGDVA